jgi:hypothetical protein
MRRVPVTVTGAKPARATGSRPGRCGEQGDPEATRPTRTHHSDRSSREDSECAWSGSPAAPQSPRTRRSPPSSGPVVIQGMGRLDSRRAAEILRRVFRNLPIGCAFRLWDGTQVNLGEGPPACTAVIARRETFVRLMRDPSPLNFAEAYVEGALDIEGDLFAAMDIANAIEEIHVSFSDRLKILVAPWRP